MSNNIITSFISDPTTQQPFLGGSLAFLQAATKEISVGLARSIMGETNYALTSTRGVCISGCTFAGFGNTITNGFIFFNGELYYFAGATGLNSYSDDPVFIALNTYDAIDPITFSDNTTHSVHQVRRLTIADQVSGTGLFDLNDMVMSNQNTGTKALLSSYTTTGSLAVFPGATFTTPASTASASGILRNYKIKLYGNVQGTFVTGQAIDVTIGIYNTTTATLLVATNPSVTAVAGMNAGNISMPFALEFKVSGVAPGTVLEGKVIRNGVSAAVLQNGYWIVEEYQS